MKKVKILKKFGMSILAVFMFFLPVLGIACTPNSVFSGEESLPPVLALDPQNDPVVYTTQNGLQIKKSNGYISSAVTTTTNRGVNYTQDLSGFYYFTMGKFSGTIYTAKTLTDSYTVSNEPVNWLIIGRGEFDFYDDTPAGSDIQKDILDQEIAVQGCYLPMSMSVIPQNAEIPKNAFLVLSEKLLGQAYFNSQGAINKYLYTTITDHSLLYSEGNYGNRYRFCGNIDTANGATSQNWTITNNAGGSLYNYINTLFSKNFIMGNITNNALGFTALQAEKIIPQQLYTYYYNGVSHLQETPSTDGGTYYSMFPLAYRSSENTIHQNFCIEDYLKAAHVRIAVMIGSNNLGYWWNLRTATQSDIQARVSVTVSGGFYEADWVRDVAGVRPAFVLSLQS